MQNVFVAKDPTHNHLYTSSAPYFPAGNTVSLLLNQKSANAPVLTDADVRQAISAGVDRQTLANQCETDYEAPASSSGGLIAPVSGSSSPLADQRPPGHQRLGQGHQPAHRRRLHHGRRQVDQGRQDHQVHASSTPPTTATTGATRGDVVSQLNKLGFDTTQVTGVQSTAWTQDVAAGHYDVTLHWGQG